MIQPAIRRLCSLLLSAGLALQLLAISPADPAMAHVPDYPVPNGHFFTQTSGVGTESLVGFTISNDGGIPLWDEYKRLGGIRALGYPTSKRFMWNGWVAQVVQRGILVWHPEHTRAEMANVMDDLSSAGYDAWLRAAQGIPAPFDPHEESGLDFEAIKERRLRFLDANPAVKQRFLAERNWQELYGLPVSFDETEQAWVLRAQRVVFYQWKVDVPWARRGTVTMAMGGDLAKEAGLLPQDVFIPEIPLVYQAPNPERPQRMLVPKLRIDAPIATFGLDQLEADGALPSPKRAGDVAWYDYSGRAGEANNAVFAGHVDWQGAPAVFARIKELVNGDQIILVGEGGTRFIYEVLGCDDIECHLPLSTRPDVDEFVGYSSFSHLTMITCEGQWDRIKRDYSHRRIVRARLVGLQNGAGAPQPVAVAPLPYSDWLFTADAPALQRQQ
ncbi:MAG TPA: class F sortase [Chloroflexota bacterium]|nr:class F sortase [Chloroflexota bacterium]